MSCTKESTKKNQPTLSYDLKKVLEFLPKIIKEKKNRKQFLYWDIMKEKDKIRSFKQELNKIIVNQISLKKDFISLSWKLIKLKQIKKLL